MSQMLTIQLKKLFKNRNNYPSIQMIRETFDNNKTFSFDFVSFDTIFKEIISLDTNKSTHRNDVPTKIVKANADL